MIKYIILIVIFSVSCNKNETIYEYEPQLEITLIDQNSQPLEGYSISVFKTIEDFDNNINGIGSNSTDEKGKTLIYPLEEIIYYIGVDKPIYENDIIVSFERINDEAFKLDKPLVYNGVSYFTIQIYVQ